MSDSESKHDRVLKRVHLWVGVLGGILALFLGVYNFKDILFPARQPAAPSAEARAQDAPPQTPPTLPSLSNGGYKIRQYDWKGSPEDFSLLDLDGNGVLNAQDSKGTGFETMDRNGDGSVERLEWRKTRRAFDLLDADGDGRVSRGEFAAYERAANALKGASSDNN